MMRPHVRADSFIPSWSNTACMRHSPMSGFCWFSRSSLATSSVTFLGALRACDLSSSPLTPSFHQRFSVVYTVCLLTPKDSAMEATDHPESMKLHNVVTTLRRIRGVIKEREAAHLDGWRRARCQHGLDRMMRGPPMKASITDLSNLADGHVRHF